MPPCFQDSASYVQCVVFWSLPQTHRDGWPRALSPHPQALSHTSHVQWPQTCISSQMECSVEEGEQESSCEREIVQATGALPDVGQPLFAHHSLHPVH
jgi:hypothetical protein